MKTSATTTGILQWQGQRTWYRVVDGTAGDAGRPPLIVCHGGPGLTHDYLLPVADLSASSQPCVFYDQFGNGRSGRRPTAPAEFWTVDLFLAELTSLIEHLGIADGFHLLGHSWGGMLALELAVRRPPGLQSIVIADAFASARAYQEGVTGLLADMPEDIRSAIDRHEAAGTTGSPEYQQAMRAFYRRHVCRATPVPDEVRQSMAALQADSTVYNAMMGASEFCMDGTLRNWTITDRLHLVEVPVLLVSGRYDEVTPHAVEELRSALPNARWVVFEESSHMPQIEERARFATLVGEFLWRQP
jgi:L-proline amide hydrolase